jgi:mediator of RNA polymerase II transcription subunit 6
MAMKKPLLDEQDFVNPQALHDLPEQDINKANNFHWYFYSSQFNEPASNNTAVLGVHVNDPLTYNVIHDKKEFATRVRSVDSGLQFVVAGEPQGEGQPWLMQRQNKVAFHDPDGKVNRIETFVEGNWYNQGNRLLMAPSLLEVVRARLLTVSTRLQRVAELSQNMDHFSPAAGHSYYPPSFEAPKAAAAGSRIGSRIGSPTLAPMDLDQSQATATAPVADADEAADQFSDALFMESLAMTNMHGDEYMDENPLKGEPGSFVFTNTKNAVGERNKAQEQAALLQLNAPRLDTRPPSVAPSIAATPKGAPTPLAIDSQSRKGSVVPEKEKKKKERRKSKGLASPTTPGVPPLG